MELCVVDSGSTNDEQTFLETRVRSRVDVLQLVPNLGFGRACNVGAELTTAPTLLITNPDTVVLSLPDGLWTGDGMGRQLVGAVKILPGGEHKPLGYPRLPTVMIESQALIFGHWKHGAGLTAEEPAWVAGAAFMIDRADFEMIGGFASDLFMYFEDADICARHAAAGGTVAIDSRFLISHGAGGSSVVRDMDQLSSALDSLNRLSGRTFAARHGRRWHRPFLYGLMVVAYLPRRSASALIARRGRPARVLFYALDLLLPRRAMRRLGVSRLGRGPR
jgi:GT2 family glycosyltransferase